MLSCIPLYVLRMIVRCSRIKAVAVNLYEIIVGSRELRRGLTEGCSLERSPLVDMLATIANLASNRAIALANAS